MSDAIMDYFKSFSIKKDLNSFKKTFREDSFPSDEKEKNQLGSEILNLGYHIEELDTAETIEAFERIFNDFSKFNLIKKYYPTFYAKMIADTHKVMDLQKKINQLVDEQSKTLKTIMYTDYAGMHSDYDKKNK